MDASALENALRLRRAGRLAEAAAIYLQTLEREPHDFEALHGLGLVHYQEGRLEEAENLIGRAVAAKPGAADAVYNRACLLAKLNRADQALAAFDTALALKPDYIEALVNRAALLEKMKRHVEALANFDRVLALKPGIAELWANRAGVLIALGRYDEAIASCDRALSLKPGNAPAIEIRERAIAMRPSLVRLEREMGKSDVRSAVESILGILNALDASFGEIDGIELPRELSALNDGNRPARFASRFSLALERLMLSGHPISASDYNRLLVYHRWVDLVLSLAPPANPEIFSSQDLRRRLVFRPLHSDDVLDLDAIWKEDRSVAAHALVHYLASRCLFHPRAFAVRERILDWLPARLDAVKLSALTVSRMADTFMHCSYALTAHKHAIKAPLMRQIRRAVEEPGFIDAPLRSHVRGRPTIVVVAENLHPGHSVHRSHSRAIAALKERFYVIGVVHPDPRGTEIAQLFDECLSWSTAPDFFAGVAALGSAIRDRGPALLFYAGVGMVPAFVALASLRLAPVQCVSYGHTATTMSEVMDSFVLPEDFVGSPDVFSERLVRLPKEAMPFAPRPGASPLKPLPDRTLRVAVPASIMKLNPKFFDALAQIQQRTEARAEIHFFPLGARALVHAALTRAVAGQVPNAVVFPEMGHEAYLEHLNRCDVFLSPFPYGNMNSIVDALFLGLPGICLDGPEAHAHADAAFFARAGLPKALVAADVGSYVDAAVKLIEDAAWREQCRSAVAKADLNTAFFTGDPRLFASAVADLIRRG